MLNDPPRCERRREKQQLRKQSGKETPDRRYVGRERAPEKKEPPSRLSSVPLIDALKKKKKKKPQERKKRKRQQLYNQECNLAAGPQLRDE